MDVWIIQDGEKTGPIHDFEIRRKIEAGELVASTPAWHEGLGEWKTLGGIDLFHGEFEKPAAPPEHTADLAATPPLPGQAHLVRRFLARWLDLYLYGGIWWISMWAAGRDIGMILNQPWIMLLYYVPWFAIEAFLIHRFATTPGKWLLGLGVVNDDGSFLSLAQSVRRASRVLFIGLGFGWAIFSQICQLIGWFTTRRLGRPLWDHAGGHRLLASPIRPLRVAAYIIILITALSLLTFVLFPFFLEDAKKRDPQFKENWEKLREEIRHIDDESRSNP